MPKQKRFKTKYAGVYYIEGTAADGRGVERIFYIHYRRDGKLIEEKAGRQFQDDMTPARASGIRAQRIEGRVPSNQVQREEEKAIKQRWTFSHLWEEYKSSNPEVKAIGKDEDRFHCYLEGTFGDKEPKDLVPLDVDRVRIKLSKTLRPATVKNVLELLRRLANFGKKKKLCDGLGFDVQMPVVNNKKTEFLTPEETASLWKVLDDDHNVQVADILKLVLLTGMRTGEIFKLRWEDVNLERGFIRIVNPKSGRDKNIPLNDATREVLTSHPRADGSPYVFPGRDDGPRRSAYNAAVRIKEKAGLPDDFRPTYGFRHNFASALAASGVSLFEIGKLLTHSSPQMTERYAHLSEEYLKKVSNRGAATILEMAKTDSGRVDTMDKRRPAEG